MFSKTCEYALRAVIFLARQSEDGKRLSIKEIAKGIGSPEHFIAKILQGLSKKGFISSTKGPNGGFFLDENQKIQPIKDIIIEIDGNKIFSNCILGLSECTENHPCPMHHEFKPVREIIKNLLDRYTLNHFIEDKKLNTTFLTDKINYN
ncbi:RrF2 family transcriptional regulator [Riemerella columbipharyngis]|uniref:Rrf2 family protein n=1 Tax=Riemerella columbipharyngis TaxID=1071918 RepID=A0A1G7BIW1_9FLAO|nr:Rrf2 family transcriptional regulator [Riemerella columbipharyngis]SDE26923.1 Rrf2 family protein [Riemerella columbipharyngis]